MCLVYQVKTSCFFSTHQFIFLVNAADSLEEIEIIRDLCCDYFSHCKKSNYYTDIFDNAYWIKYYEIT
ncbi:hypothetical protein KWD53_17830 [Acinetobacter baumannii]